MKRFKITAAAETSTVYVYEEIGEWGVSANTFREQLAEVDSKHIDLRINSPGGDVFDGIAIYNLLRQHPAAVSVNIDGWAASAASVIAMAGDKVQMASNAFMLVHAPWTVVGGNAADMRQMADQLEAVESSLVDTYAARRGIDRGLVEKWVRDETLFAAEDAVEVGLADSLTAETAIAAKADFDAYAFLPGTIRQMRDYGAAQQAKVAANHRQRRLDFLRNRAK